MEIVIHGTKKGRKIFTPKEIKGLFDVTADSPKASAIGHNAYAIRFISNNAIFSKYKIIRDVRGAKRTGFLAFSLFLSNNENLSGSDIITLLDKVSEDYCLKYIVDNNWNEVTEDWAFVERLSSEYVTKIRIVSGEDSENMQSGSKDDAFIYFNDTKELHSYFNNPFQEEYIPHRQIFFINSNLKDKPENPLKALRNSGDDLTGIIDLENPPLKLKDFYGTGKDGISITIENSKGRILLNKDKVYRKEKLTVVYSKKYYKEKRIFGSLLDSTEIREHLFVSNDNKIDVKKNIDLESELKTITFEVVKKDGSRVMDAVITCKSNYQSKQIINNQVTFSGEDLNERWTVLAKKGDNLFSTNYIIDFDKDFQNNISIILNERRILKIIAKEEEYPQNGIPKFKVWVQGKGNYSENDDIEFVNNDLYKSFDITVGCEGYQNSENLSYHPSNDGNKTIYINLKKTHKLTTKTGESQNEKDFENDYPRIKNDNPFYQNPRFIAGLIVSTLVIFIGLWSLSNYLDKDISQEKSLTADKIKTYINGDALILDTLNAYKANWEKQNPSKKEKDDGLFRLFFPSDSKTISPEEIKKWKQTHDSIDNAINKRTLIDNKKFVKLKKENFSNPKSFEKTIDNIKKDKYELLEEKLGDVADLTLTQIAKKINDILNSKETTKKDEPKSRDEPKQPTPSATAKPVISVQPTEPQSPKELKTIPDKTDKISQYLKGGDMKKVDLEDYKTQTTDANLKKSIDLALKFWTLDGSRNNSYSSYLKEINSNSNLKNSVLNSIVSDMNKKENPKYIKTIAGFAGKSLDQLKSDLK